VKGCLIRGGAELSRNRSEGIGLGTPGFGQRWIFLKVISNILLTWILTNCNHTLVVVNLLTAKHSYSHHPYCCYVYVPGTTRCTSLLFILLFIQSQCTVLHILYCFFFFYCTFYSLFLLFFLTYIYINARVALILIFLLSTERIWLDLHFTSDYTLYNLLCEE